jgi:hypothetical protein
MIFIKEWIELMFFVLTEHNIFYQLYINPCMHSKYKDPHIRTQ